MKWLVGGPCPSVCTQVKVKREKVAHKTKKDSGVDSSSQGEEMLIIIMVVSKVLSGCWKNKDILIKLEKNLQYKHHSKKTESL